MKKVKNWLIKKLGAVSVEEHARTVRRFMEAAENAEQNLIVYSKKYGEAAQKLIRAKDMLRIYPNDGPFREFICQFRVDERLVYMAFNPGSDEEEIKWFGQQVGLEVYHAIKSANYIRPAEYRIGNAKLPEWDYYGKPNQKS